MKAAPTNLHFKVRTSRGFGGGGALKAHVWGALWSVRAFGSWMEPAEAGKRNWLCDVLQPTTGGGGLPAVST